MHQLTDKQEIETIAELKAVHALLANRIRQEALALVECPPPIVMSREEKNDLSTSIRLINEFFSIANKCRDLSNTLSQDWVDYAIQEGVQNDANQSLIEDAKKALDEMQFGFELDDKQHEVIECQPIQNNK